MGGRKEKEKKENMRAADAQLTIRDVDFFQAVHSQTSISPSEPPRPVWTMFRKILQEPSRLFGRYPIRRGTGS